MMPVRAFDAEMATALAALRGLTEVYPPTASDIVEVSIDSAGRAGALVFPDRGGTLRQLHEALGMSGVDRGRRQELELLWRGIASQRCATRLLAGGGISLFWPIDLEATSICRLADGLGFELEIDHLGHFFEEVDAAACGMAYECGGRHEPRLRLYHMAGDRVSVERALRAGELHLGLPQSGSSWLLAWAEAALTARESAPLVVNVAVDRAGSRSIKLEMPEVALGSLPGAPSLTTADASFWTRASQAAVMMGTDRFNFVGVRCHATGAREFTAYVDARAWVAARTEEVRT